jgi:sugar phosphate isomerase/epimerase
MWSVGFKVGDREALPVRPMDAFDLLLKARDLGVHVVQYGPFHQLDKLGGEKLDALAAQARGWDIELELATRGLEIGHLGAQLDIAQRIGAGLLRTIPELGGKPANPAATVEGVRAVLPRLEAMGIKLGLENGNLPALDLKGVLDHVHSPLAGVVLDTANSLAVPEGWKYVAEILAPYAICLHHKEFVVRRVWSMMGFTVEGRPAGQGQVDTPWLLEVLKKAGAQFNVILEAWPPEQDTLEETIALEERWVQESIPYLRGLIKD